jgi:hypothetical protein
MLPCLPFPIQENTESIKLVRILKILCGIEFCLGIFSIFVDVGSGVLMITGALILGLVIWISNWLMSIIYMLLAISDVITSIFIIGNYYSGNDDDYSQILLIIFMLRFPFDLVAVYYCFLFYREVKGQYIEYVEQPHPQGYGVMQNWYEVRNNPPPPVASQPEPFTGQGYRLG